MPRQQPPSEDLFARPAELRATGATCEAVAKEVGRAARTIRGWPRKFAERWTTALVQAETKRAKTERRNGAEMTSKRAETTTKLAEPAPNRSIFSGFWGIFQRKCFADQELALWHPDDTSKPSPRQDLRHILSSNNRQNSRKILSEQEIREAARAEQKMESHTKYNNRRESAGGGAGKNARPTRNHRASN